jgi:ribosomal protein S18 acetylase RimI-like enzyme
MKIRAAAVGDAPAMGRVMVESWLTAHRGQMPDAAWQKRVDEWTPEASGAAWARLLAERAAPARDDQDRVVLLVAEGDAGDPLGLVLGTEAEDDPSGSTAEIVALYVKPDRQGRGIGRTLLGEGARELARLGFSALHIGVLTANLPARAFYEAMGGQEIGQRTFDEEGVVLPGTVYAWPDITSLVGSPGPPS